jgi:hypothetical protein
MSTLSQAEHLITVTDVSQQTTNHNPGLMLASHSPWILIIDCATMQAAATVKAATIPTSTRSEIGSNRLLKKA